MKRFVIITLLLLGCSCNRTGRSSPAYFSTMSSVNVYFGMFVQDDSLKLQRALDGGLPLDNLYWESGNFNPSCYSETKAKDGLSLLMLACMANATNCVHELERAGADLSVRSQNSATILHYLYGLKADEAIRLAKRVLLLEGICVDDMDNLGRTPLWFALKHGNFKYAEWLQMKGANFNRMRKMSSLCEKCDIPYAYDAITFPFESFLYCVRHENILPGDCTWDELVLHLNPIVDGYDDRVSEIVLRGADINYREGKESVFLNVLKGSLIVRVTGERIQRYVQLGLNQESLRSMLNYAREHDLPCTKVIEDILGEETKAGEMGPR